MAVSRPLVRILAMAAWAVRGAMVATATNADAAKTTRAAASRPANPLSALPSREGPRVEQIRALGDNAWLSLGRPAADPTWGGRALNVHFSYLANDSSDRPGTMLVGRHKRARPRALRLDRGAGRR